MKMGGSGVNIPDMIYLNDGNYPITLTGSMRTGRTYSIGLNTSSYVGGDVVVEPSDYPTNAAQYLRFNVPAQAGYVFAKGGAEDKSIVLKQCLFVDGVNGDDSNSGVTPAVPLKTMGRALKIAEQGEYVIYICGKVTAGTETWSCEAPVVVKRYTGFSIGGSMSFSPYAGTMFEVPAGAALTLGKNVSLIMGRNTDDDAYRPTGSVFDVKGTLTLDNAGLTIEGNMISSGDGGAINNSGTVNVSAAATIQSVSAANGGAIWNAGTLNVDAALTIDNAGANGDGGAIYNTGTVNVSSALAIGSATAGGNGSAVYQAGEFVLSGDASLETGGVVYLTNGSYLTLSTADAQMTNPLSLDIGDPSDGRVYARYMADAAAETERARYSLPVRITSTYTLMDDTMTDGAGSGLALYLGQKNVVYVDPTFDGEDISGRVKGDYADYPFKTLEEAYKKLAEVGGGLIYVVTPITVDQNTTVGAGGYVQGDVSVTLAEGMVSLKRYSRPTASMELFTHETNADELFTVKNGAELTLDGVVLDGHAQAVTNAGDKYKNTIAAAVKTDKPMVSIESGKLILKNDAELVSCDRAIDNADVLSVEGETKIDGSVYLAADKVVSVTTGAETGANAVRILLDDAKNGRVIASYTQAPAETEKSKYLLDSSITALYKLEIQGNDIVLVAKGAAYVDGRNGDDTLDGTTPAKAVKTLKQAYENLAADGGGTIYIVDTVTIDQSIALTESRYADSQSEIAIEDGTVTIRRYSKPEASVEGFTKASCTGVMFSIAEDGSLTLQSIVVDGHSQRFDAGKAETTAGGVNAQAAMLDVRGALTIEAETVLRNNNNTSASVGGGAIRIRSTGKVSIHGGEMVGNEADMGGSGVYNFGRLEISGEPKLDVTTGAEQWIFMDQNHVIYVTDALNIANPLPVDLTDPSYQNGHVIAVYSDGLTPNHRAYRLRDQYNRMETRSLSLTTEEQNVLLMAAYKVDYSGLENIGRTDDSPDRAAHGKELDITLTTEPGYILPSSITVKRIEEDGTETVLKPKASADDPDGDYIYDQKTGKVTVDGDAVTGKIALSGAAIQSFTAEYDCTLYAVETNQAAAYSQTETIRLTELTDQMTSGKVPLMMLAGRRFNVASITTESGVQLVNPSDIAAVKTTAGYDYANAHFAIGAKAGGAQETPLVDAGVIEFADDLTEETATLALTLYNANAITIPDTDATAPVVEIVLRDADLPESTASTLTLRIAIKRVASRIDVTVPLVVVAKTNIDGGVADLSSSNYAISNHSDMRIQLAEKTVTNNADSAKNPLTLTTQTDLSGMVDSYSVAFDDAVRDIAAADEEGASVNPLKSLAISRLSFVTKESADGVEYGVKAATIQYKLQIPKENLTVNP